MGDELNVSPEEVRDASQTIRKALDRLESDFDQAKKDADAVLGGSWTGHLADRAREGWEEWVTGYSNAVQALADSLEALNSAAADYDSTEGENTATINWTTPDRQLRL